MRSLKHCHGQCSSSTGHLAVQFSASAQSGLGGQAFSSAAHSLARQAVIGFVPGSRGEAEARQTARQKAARNMVFVPL